MIPPKILFVSPFANRIATRLFHQKQSTANGKLPLSLQKPSQMTISD